MSHNAPPPSEQRRPPSAIRTSSNHSITTPSSSLAGSGVPASPRTPQRPTGGGSSIYSSPGLYRQEEDQVIFELGARHVRAGLAGEASPRATITFGPSESRRVDDFREWLPDYQTPDPSRTSTTEWGREHELWQLDTRQGDAGLVEDRLERALRDAYTRFLLVDPKSRRVAVVLPELLPTNYIDAAVSILYRDLQVPNVSVFAAAAMSVVAAGLRSGLVVDIGWNETVASAIYELRQVDSRRSTRAVRLATLHTARLLVRHGPDGKTGDLEEAMVADGEAEHLPISLSEAEEAFVRAGWCQSMAQVSTQRRQRKRPTSGKRQISGSWPDDTIEEEEEDDEDKEEQDDKNGGGTRKRPSSSDTKEGEHSQGRRTAPIDPNSIRTADELPISAFSQPIESAFFANGRPTNTLDDGEQTLPDLIYRTLVALPPDVRGTCISRITFTGGGSRVPGLRSRLLAELKFLIDTHGFDPVRGAAADRLRAKQATQARELRARAQILATKTRYPANSAGLPASETPTPIPAGLLMPERHPIDERLARDAANRAGAGSGSSGGSGASDGRGYSIKGVTGIVRVLETLGPWAGASLLVSSRVKAVVDVHPEEFERLGITSGVGAGGKLAAAAVGAGGGSGAGGGGGGGGGGAAGAGDGQMQAQRASMVAGRDGKGWTLGMWSSALAS